MGAMRFSYRFALVYGLGIAVVLFFTSGFIGQAFTNDPQALATSSMHLSLVPWSYGFLGMSMIAVSAFNAVGKPTPGMLVSMSRTIGIYAPMAFVLAWLLELRGVFLAAFLANIIAGLLGFFWFRYAMRPYFGSESESAAAK